MALTNNNQGIIRIGISNTVVPGIKKDFPPPYNLRSRLHYYSSIFNTIEVNSCFYKTPMLKTYERWAADVPEDFQFTLKLSKEVTHVKELKGELACMNTFIQNASALGHKKGCLLIQFPGKITLDYFQQVENIMYQLDQEDAAKEWKKAVEFRNPTWYIRETWDMLDEYAATMVLHDKSKAKLTELSGNASFVYLRFHGPKGDYRGSYEDSFLRDKAEEIRQWIMNGKDVYAYFNNTAGNAYENAFTLKSMLT
jgi:uncharacterized protein YecE (DUF72 family)